ncbi:alpha/beta-hydrolase [Teratosphaeria nubilosa]|uniref:Alpha/beta-hydrolase n=1 Tax=Teratosphaeria nubilosa TaxID=161662 RepID=A0A6G1KZ96_9PEZI|nr:alpha/beta-hydrolase [Teratosphaeria nubilosa]
MKYLNLGGCALLALPYAAATSNSTTHGEVPYIRDFFYAGGEYTSDGSGGHIFHNPMYVEHLKPAAGERKAIPLVFIHGQAQTGTNFLNKPDGGAGWASYFIRQGYELYIVDQTLRGRSAWQPSAGATEPSTYSTEIIQERFTAPRLYDLWPQAVNHTQWPGNGTMGDPTYDAFYSSNVQFINNATYQQRTVQAAGAQLLDRIGKKVILIGHSQGGLMPPLIADVRPNLTEAIILLEPTGPPFQEAIFSNTSARPYGVTDIPITYSPPVTTASTDLVRQTYPATSADLIPCILQSNSTAPRRLVNLASKPILLVTTQASYHAPYDYCTYEYYRQAGCSKAEHLDLPKVGVFGNAHMMFMEENSDVIAGLLKDWIEKL